MSAPSPQEDARQEGPHSRACGIRCQGHGSACSKDCPTCGGRPVAAPTEDAAEADVLALAQFLIENRLRGQQISAYLFDPWDMARAVLAAGWRKDPTCAEDHDAWQEEIDDLKRDVQMWKDVLATRLSPAQVREREAAAWDAGKRSARKGCYHADGWPCICANPFRTGSAT